MLNLLKPHGYNRPTSLAMLASQWAHQLYLWRIVSYDRYASIQAWFWRKRT